jgi:5-methylcytosine-specific restriction protein A
MGSGLVVAEPKEDKHWDPDRAAAGDTGFSVKILFDVLSEVPLIGEGLLSVPPLSSPNWYPHASGISISSEITDALESEWAKVTGMHFTPLGELELPSVYLEGTRRTRLIKSFERNPKAREQCIAHHGARCKVCGLAFDERYGEIGAGFIHVHHLVPIADIKDEYEVDPIHDLCPVCPNCHAMLHKRPKPLTPDELKKMMEASSKKSGDIP